MSLVEELNSKSAKIRSAILVQMISKDPQSFWYAFDRCRNDNERKKLLDWIELDLESLLTKMFSGTATLERLEQEAMAFITQFIGRSDLDPDAYDINHSRRRWGLLYFLEKNPTLIDCLVNNWMAQEVWCKKLCEVFFAEASLLLQERDRFPELLKNFAIEIFSGRSFTPEIIALTQKISEAGAPEIKSEQNKQVIFNVKAAFILLFYLPDNELELLAREVGHLEAHGQKARATLYENMRLGFFCQQRNDLLAKLLMTSQKTGVCEALFKDEGNFAKLAKLFHNPSKFVKEYGDDATAQSLCQVVMYAVKFARHDLESLWNVNLGLRRGTVGEAVISYIQGLLAQRDFSRLSSLEQQNLSEFLTSPAIFDYYPFKSDEIFALLKSSRQLPIAIAESLAFDPFFKSLLAEQQLISLAAQHAPFLIKAMLMPNELLIVCRRMSGEGGGELIQGLLEYFQSILNESTKKFQTNYQAELQVALTALASDPAISQDFLNNSSGYEKIFLAWASQNSAWRDRIISGESVPRGLRDACKAQLPTEFFKPPRTEAPTPTAEPSSWLFKKPKPF